jgi:hypothetical protein
MTIQQPNSRERYRTFELPNGLAEVWLERAGSLVSMHTVRPNGSGSANWERCDIDGCLGQAVVQQSKCLRHASVESRDQYLSALGSSNQPLLLNGVVVNQDLADAILRSPIISDRRVKVPILLQGAEIDARLDFDGYTFEHSLALNGTIVHQLAAFGNCTFKGPLTARFTFFKGGPPSFRATNFSEAVDFSYAHAEPVSIGFSDCSFAKPFTADGIVALLQLEQCRFESDFAISAADAPMIIIQGCSLDGELDVANTRCAAFRAPYLRAAAAHQIGPLDVKADCTISHAQFASRVRIEVQANHLDLSGTQLLEGGHILVERAQVSLNQLSTGRSLRISGVGNSTQKPVILALQDADTGSMSFADVDMSRCVFYGSHDLGGVVIEPTVKFARTPAWGYSRRRCVADEFAWRQHTGGFRSRGWSLPGTGVAGDDRHEGDGGENAVVLPALRATQVAAVYRDLRRSFEAKSDEPGAADFYYGEMEMRRHSREVGMAERAIVWVYWVVSGYGLRASRAFGWLLLLIVGASFAMAHTGFKEGQATYLESLIFSLRATLPGLQGTSNLTTIGDLIEIGLTILGPVLFGLALLALRGRVKR